ncbi:MAG TPA: rhodanese-like domain-containing protein [Ktedonobacteraceae bacterium]|jgi:rhodanese-related sulfurtransferase|nr:rhodanese-like domain-containing protein [Ktedonobacteraceae bacterium]
MEPMSVNDMVADARTRIKGLSMEEMQRELESGDALIIDIRDVRERWREGTIPGAKHVPRGMLEFWADPQSEYHKKYMDPNRRTIVYCAGGLRSSLAADVLQKMGYKDVAHLEMGFDGWKKAGGAYEEVPIPEEYRKG